MSNTITVSIEATNDTITFIAEGPTCPKAFARIVELNQGLHPERYYSDNLWKFTMPTTVQVKYAMYLLHLHGHDIVRIHTTLGRVDGWNIIEGLKEGEEK